MRWSGDMCHLGRHPELVGRHPELVSGSGSDFLVGFFDWNGYK
jgi:hypothetical protein